MVRRSSAQWKYNARVLRDNTREISKAYLEEICTFASVAGPWTLIWHPHSQRALRRMEVAQLFNITFFLISQMIILPFLGNSFGLLPSLSCNQYYSCRESRAPIHSFQQHDHFELVRLRIDKVPRGNLLFRCTKLNLY